MSRIARTRAKSSQARMYTHFAVVTVVATAVIAMFAKSEDHSDAAETMAEAEAGQPDQVDLAAQGKQVNQIQVRERNSEQLAGSFGPDNMGGGFSGDSYVSGMRDYSYNPTSTARSLHDLPDVGSLTPNMTPEKWNEILERRRKELLEQQQEAVRQEDIDSMIALSRQRSGSAKPAVAGSPPY